MCLTVKKYKDRTGQSKKVNFFLFYKYNPGSISKLQRVVEAELKLDLKVPQTLPCLVKFP